MAAHGRAPDLARAPARSLRGVARAPLAMLLWASACAHDFSFLDAAVPADAGAGCVQAGVACTPNVSVCCLDFACGTQPQGSFCCHPAQGRCTVSRDCCGSMVCEGRQCACRSPGQTCTADTDCCFGLPCVPDGAGGRTCLCRVLNADCQDTRACCGTLRCQRGVCGL